MFSTPVEQPILVLLPDPTSRASRIRLTNLGGQACVAYVRINRQEVAYNEVLESHGYFTLVAPDGDFVIEAAFRADAKGSELRVERWKIKAANLVQWAATN